uniref:DUF1266 domain-containing protein n=1 Tax=Escherichia coli TaxID=562 RepID=UPI0028809396
RWRLCHRAGAGAWEGVLMNPPINFLPYSNWRQYFAGYTFGRQYWQSPEDDHLPLLREFLARKEYDDSGNDMFYQLFASDDAYYPTLSWQPLAYYSACPETLKDMSDL